MTISPKPPALRDAATLPASDADPFGHEVLENPIPLHRFLRDAGPLVHLTKYDVYAMARYREVRDALVDWQNFESSAGVGLSNFRYETPWRSPSLLLEADPPRHDAPRRVLTKILAPPALRRLREEWLADAEVLVDEVLTRGTVVDGVKDLAEAFPLRVFPDAVGIAKDGRENLLPYGDHLFNAFGPPNDLVAAGADRAPTLLAWVQEQCERPKLDAHGFGAQIWASADRGEITPAQAPLVTRTLLSAGVDTTVHALSAMMHAFATHPDQWNLLRAKPSLARAAFDEAVRWESPVQTFFRTATRDVRVGDHVVPEGRKILLFLGAANRDPRHWSSPDAYDLTRDPSGHVGFGMGIHQCVGQHVARLEAEALLGALARRVRRIEPADLPTRHHNNTLRAWQSIPLRFILDD